MQDRTIPKSPASVVAELEAGQKRLVNQAELARPPVFSRAAGSSLILKLPADLQRNNLPA
jgi:hypothetical protein